MVNSIDASMLRLHAKYSIFRTKDFFNKFANEFMRIFDIYKEAELKTIEELKTGKYDPGDFTTHTKYNCSVVLLVGAFEYLLEQIKLDKKFAGKLNLWDIEFVNNWLKKSFSFKITDLISKDQYRYLIILFAYRHKIVHNIGIYDKQYIDKVKPLYEKLGYDTSDLIDGTNILLEPKIVAPMFVITYDLSGKLMERLYPELKRLKWPTPPETF